MKKLHRILEIARNFAVICFYAVKLIREMN